MDHTTRRNIDYLDRHVPLHGASHADVIMYSIDIPLRYAECRADLGGGRSVRLLDKRQFVGWSGHEVSPALLFVCDTQWVLLRTGPRPEQSAARPEHMARFIGMDGDLLEVDLRQVMEVSCHVQAPRRHTRQLQIGLATHSPALVR